MRRLVRIVIREIILRDLDRKALIEITEILVPDREGRPCWAEAPVQEPGDGGEEAE